MEENRPGRYVAIIERCTMSENGLRHLLPMAGNYQFYFFKNYTAFLNAQARTPFFSLIYSLSAIRAQRLECLKAISCMEQTSPGLQRIVLAGNDMEARLVSRFSPVSLHGVISKTASLGLMREQLQKWLKESQRPNENILNLWYYSYDRILNQTERDILYYTALGYPSADIAVQLKRHSKNISGYKFSLMSKLGVDTDAGLFYAADILMQMEKVLNKLPVPQQQIPA